MENFEPVLSNFEEEYIKIKKEKAAVKKTAGFVGVSFIILMVLPYFLSTMITNLLRALGLSTQETAAIISEPMFLTVTQIFLSFIIFTLPFAVLLFGEHLKLTKIVSFKKPKKEFFWPLALICIGVTAFANVVANMLTGIFNFIGIPVTAPDFDMPKGVLGFIVTFLCVAVTPALVEELAMRGIVLGSLKRYGKGFAVGVSAIIFGMMHGNLSQIPFAFILGIAIGIAVIKTDSIWTGVVIHLINNGVSVILDAIITKTESNQVLAFINSLYFALCTLAFFVGIYLLKGKTKEIFEFDEEKSDISLTQKLKWFFSAPAIIVSIVLTAFECILALFIY